MGSQISAPPCWKTSQCFLQHPSVIWRSQAGWERERLYVWEIWGILDLGLVLSTLFLLLFGSITITPHAPPESTSAVFVPSDTSAISPATVPLQYGRLATCEYTLPVCYIEMLKFLCLSA